MFSKCVPCIGLHRRWNTAALISYRLHTIGRVGFIVYNNIYNKITITSMVSNNCIFDASPSEWTRRGVDASPSWDDASSKYATIFQCKIWCVAELSWRAAELSRRVAELRWRLQNIIELKGFLVILAEGSWMSFSTSRKFAWSVQNNMEI